MGLNCFQPRPVPRPLQHPWASLPCTSSTADCCTVLKGQLWKQRQTTIAVLPCPDPRVCKEQIFPCPAAVMQWQCYSQESIKSVLYTGLVREQRERSSQRTHWVTACQYQLLGPRDREAGAMQKWRWTFPNWYSRMDCGASPSTCFLTLLFLGEKNFQIRTARSGTFAVCS